MKKKISLYDDNWLLRMKSGKNKGTWFHDVLENLSGSGDIYLNIIKDWYDKFPANSNKKTHLKTLLESDNNADHLGGVNELCWFKFMKLCSWNIVVLNEKGKHPDFHIIKPFEFFCEVTTLNISKEDKNIFSAGQSVALNHQQTIDRIVRKISSEKLEQIKYRTFQKKPSVLVIFDYTSFSGYGTQFYIVFSKYLFEKKTGFINLPVELSAIVYIEKQFRCGRFGISKLQSAIYHNPFAQYKLPKTIFQMIQQYQNEEQSVQPAKNDNYWIWLQ